MLTSPGRHLARALALLSLLGLASCGSVFQSRDVRFSLGETRILMLESGAIIVGKRQVGRSVEAGKVVDSLGRVLAWVHERSIRLRGGALLAIKTDREGSLFIPASMQREAGLEPVAYRVRTNRTLARTRGAQGIPISGYLPPERRRLVLLVLLLTQNARWQPPAP